MFKVTQINGSTRKPEPRPNRSVECSESAVSSMRDAFRETFRENPEYSNDWVEVTAI